MYLGGSTDEVADSLVTQTRDETVRTTTVTDSYLSFAASTEEDRAIASFTKRLEVQLGLRDATTGERGAGSMIAAAFEQLVGSARTAEIKEQLVAARNLMRDPQALVQRVLKRLQGRIDALDEQVLKLELLPLPTQLQQVQLQELRDEIADLEAYEAHWLSGLGGHSYAKLLVEALEEVEFASVYYRQILRSAVAQEPAYQSGGVIGMRKGLQALLSVWGFEHQL